MPMVPPWMHRNCLACPVTWLFAVGSDVGYGELGFSSVVNLPLLLFHSISTTNDTKLGKVRFLDLDSDNLAVFSIWY